MSTSTKSLTGTPVTVRLAPQEGLILNHLSGGEEMNAQRCERHGSQLSSKLDVLVLE